MIILNVMCKFRLYYYYYDENLHQIYINNISNRMAWIDHNIRHDVAAHRLIVQIRSMEILLLAPFFYVLLCVRAISNI